MDATSFTAELDALLKSIPELQDQIFDGHVDKKLLTDSLGFIRPYVLYFAGISSDIGDPDLSGKTDTNVHDWAPQTNCVGAEPKHARYAAQLVAKKLTNARIGNHRLHPDTDAFRVAVPIKDDQATPARFFLPLSWRLTTN